MKYSKLFGAGALEERLSRLGFWTIFSVTALLLVLAGVDWENIFLLVLIMASLIMVRGTGAEIPFMIMTLHLLVSTVYAALFLKVWALELPDYFAALSRRPDVLWFGFYIFFAALGSRLASLIFRCDKFAGRELLAAQIPLPILFPLWALFIVIAIVYPHYDSPAIRILVHHVIPLLSIALIMCARNSVVILAIVVVSLIPPALTTYRHIIGLYLLSYALVYLLWARKSDYLSRRGIPLLAATLAFGTLSFYGMTFLKYGEYPAEHAFTRIALIQAHSALRIKEAVDSGGGLSTAERERMGMYWLSLIPFVEKPINSGHFTYGLARQNGLPKGDTPYLPPAAPAELYLTGGMSALIVGAAIHGFLLGSLWIFSGRILSSKLQVAGTAMAVTVLCGIGGGADLYGRLAAVKWTIFILVFFWLIAALLNRGVVLRYSIRNVANS